MKLAVAIAKQAGAEVQLAKFNCNCGHGSSLLCDG